MRSLVSPKYLSYDFTHFDLASWSAISPVIRFQDLFRAERFIENTRRGGSRKNRLRVTDSGYCIPTFDEQVCRRGMPYITRLV